MSNLTQPPKKVFEVDSCVTFASFLFFTDGENLIVQTNDIELGNTLKEFSGKVKFPVRVLTDLLTGITPLVIDFESEKKNFTLTIYNPTVKLLEEGV